MTKQFANILIEEWRNWTKKSTTTTSSLSPFSCIAPQLDTIFFELMFNCVSHFALRPRRPIFTFFCYHQKKVIFWRYYTDNETSSIRTLLFFRPQAGRASSPQRGCAQRCNFPLFPKTQPLGPRWSRPLMRLLVYFFYLSFFGECLLRKKTASWKLREENRGIIIFCLQVFSGAPPGEGDCSSKMDEYPIISVAA